MKCRMIATWKMAYDGVHQSCKLLQLGKTSSEAIEHAIRCVEDTVEYCSVGFGGLPNCQGQVELDSGFMDGKTLGYGAIMGVHDIKNPISVAKSLANRKVNCVLASHGANQYAKDNHFELKNMLSESAYQRYLNQKETIQELKAYDGHDTVCMIAKDKEGNMATGVSTSGLFMKEVGRIGDSPIIGSGFYCDNEVGGAAATGLGEDIMRGCLSIRILERVKLGMDIQLACDSILDEHIQRMDRSNQTCDAISLIAMDKDGNYGASTNIEEFPYVIMNDDGQAEIHVASYKNKIHSNFQASPEWIQSYTGD